MISIKQLKYALAVEQTLHFKRASELCHISQSALSTAVSELEQQLGLKIFERDNKKVLVTPVGKQVLEKARRILVEVDELQYLADSQRAPLSYPMTVGVIPTIAPYLLPRLLPVISARYPNAQVNIVEDQSQVLVDSIRRGDIDAGILALPYDCEGLLTMEFWQEDFYWVAPKDQEYARQAEITSAEVGEGSLMLLQEGHCLKDHILEVCELAEHGRNDGVSATSLYTLIQMVKGGLGTTLIPAMAKDDLMGQEASLAAVHLKEPGPHRRIAFVLRPNYTRMSSIEALIESARQALQ